MVCFADIIIKISDAIKQMYKSLKMCTRNYLCTKHKIGFQARTLAFLAETAKILYIMTSFSNKNVITKHSAYMKNSELKLICKNLVTNTIQAFLSFAEFE